LGLERRRSGLLLGTRHLGARASGGVSLDARLLVGRYDRVLLASGILVGACRLLRRHLLRIRLLRPRFRRRVLERRASLLQPARCELGQYTSSARVRGGAAREHGTLEFHRRNGRSEHRREPCRASGRTRDASPADLAATRPRQRRAPGSRPTLGREPGSAADCRDCASRRFFRDGRRRGKARRRVPEYGRRIAPAPHAAPSACTGLPGPGRCRCSIRNPRAGQRARIR